MFEDAPLDQAVEGVVNGIFFNQGHVCCAGSRLLVQEPIFEPLLEKLKARLDTLRVGDPLDKNTDIGAINSRAQLSRIEELVAAGVEEGAEIYQPACDLPERGFWFRPTLFTGVSQSHRIAREEIFGPVLSILTFRTPEEAVEKANNTPYGLSAGVWTEKGSRILWMAERLKAGVVWANTFNRFDPASPFGGYKESRLRPRGRPARAGALRGALDRRGTARHEREAPPRQADREAVHRRRVPAERVGALLRGPRRPTASSWPGRRARRARTSGTPCEPRAPPRPAWAAKTAFNRGQILYRVAELMEGRRSQFEGELKDAGAKDPAEGRERRDRSLGLVRGVGGQDRIRSRAPPTPSPGRTSTSRSPSRPAWSGSWLPQDQSLLGLVSRLAPAIVSGNTAVVLASEQAPLPAVSLGEVLATSDVPGGVVNILTGFTKELVPWLAGHMDVNAIDATGVPEELRAEVEELSAENVKRVHRAPDADPFDRRGAEPLRGHGAGGVQDRLAPDGRLRSAISQRKRHTPSGVGRPTAGLRFGDAPL